MISDAVSESMVFAGRNVEHIRRIPEKLADVTLQPLMFVVLFAYLFGGAIAIPGGNYHEYLLGGILIQSLGFGLTGPAISIANDLTNGVIFRFRALPVRLSSYLAGHYISELAGLILSMTILMLSGLIIGWRVQSDLAHFALALLLLLLFASAMVWVGTWFGLVARSADAVMGVAYVVVFPLTFLSNAFVPMGTLPNALQWFVAYNPVSVMVSAIRTLFGNPLAPVTKDVWPMQHPVAAAFIYCAIILSFAVPAAIHRFRIRTTA